MWPTRVTDDDINVILSGGGGGDSPSNVDQKQSLDSSGKASSVPSGDASSCKVETVSEWLV